MRYLLAIFGVFTMQMAWADVVINVVDQDNKPVPNAIVSLPRVSVDTSQTVAVMDQIDSTFVPHVLVIQKGQSVRFPNSDNIRHHVYSFSEPKEFEIKLYNGSDIAPILFDKSGLVVLGCNIHDSMIGYIYVADNYFSMKTDAQGRVTVPAKLGDDIIIWDEHFVDGTQTTKQYKIIDEKAQTISLDLLPSFEEESQSGSDSHQYHYDF